VRITGLPSKEKGTLRQQEYLGGKKRSWGLEECTLDFKTVRIPVKRSKRMYGCPRNRRGGRRNGLVVGDQVGKVGGEGKNITRGWFPGRHL